MNCILEGGVTAASGRQVAKRAGVTWSVIQYHFGDREGLLMAVVDQGLGELFAAVSRVSSPASEVPPTRDRVQRIVDVAWQEMSSPTSRAATEILITNRAVRSEVAHTAMARLMATFIEIGRMLNDDIDPRTGAALGILLLNTLRGMVASELMVSTSLDMTADRTLLVDVLITFVSNNGLLNS